MNLEEKENMPEMGAQTAAPEQTAVSGLFCEYDPVFCDRFCIDPDVVFIFILLYSAEYYKTYQTTDPGDRSGGERGSDGTIGCDRRIGGPGAQRFYEYHDRQDQ